MSESVKAIPTGHVETSTGKWRTFVPGKVEKQMDSLIIGYGEVGEALHEVIKPSGRHCLVYDSEDGREVPKGEYTIDLMHICIPYSQFFESIVRAYQRDVGPEITVIHSTVPVGTSRRLKAVHSPVVGIHPRMKDSLLAFTKFIGGREFGADKVAEYFRRCGIKVHIEDHPETTELCKLQCTAYYGLMIEFTKEMKRLLDYRYMSQPSGSEPVRGPEEFNAGSFAAWKLWIDNYNQGYTKLGHPEYVRPNLEAIMQAIGGHCVATNYNLIDTVFTRFLKELNQKS